MQRLDYSVLVPYLQPKKEYVISITLTDLQKRLYKYYLDNYAKAGQVRFLTHKESLNIYIFNKRLVLMVNWKVGRKVAFFMMFRISQEFGITHAFYYWLNKEERIRRT